MKRRKTQRAGSNRNTKVKNESYENAYKRNHVFFHYKLKGQNPPKNLRFLSPQEQTEVQRILLKARREGKSADEIIQEIFKADPVQFQQEFINWEEHKPNLFLNKGTPYERRAFPIAGSLDRFISTISNSPEKFKYKSDFQVHICDSSNFTDPVSSLSDKYCVAVLTPDMKEQYNDNKGDAYALSYIIVKPQFFPPRVTVSGGPINLNAGRIPVVSFLLDAFRQNGVVEIEPTLRQTLEREAPELLAFSEQEPVVLVSPEVMKDPSTTQERFIVVDSAALPRGRNVVNMKNFYSKTSLKQAFQDKRVYFMDPRTMFEIRTRFPKLWVANFGPANQPIFERLGLHEKLTFSFLLYKKFEEQYSLLKNTGTEKALASAKETVFETDYATGGNPFELAENFDLEDEENLRQLIKFQETVLHSAEIRTSDGIRQLLSKFSPGQSIRIAKYPPELLDQRGSLLKTYQHALQSPVSNSRVPSFLRTRKAKNTNVERWRNRVKTAKNALLQFNRKYGIHLSRGAEQYNF
jgi:hypothetical protein